MRKWNWIWLQRSIFFFLLNFQAHRSHTNVCSCCCFLLLNVLLLYVPCLIKLLNVLVRQLILILKKLVQQFTNTWLSCRVNPLNQSISCIGGRNGCQCLCVFFITIISIKMLALWFIFIIILSYLKKKLSRCNKIINACLHSITRPSCLENIIW